MHVGRPSTTCRRRSAGFTARMFSSKAAAKLSILTCTKSVSEKDRAVPDEGADPEQHDRDKGIDLQGIVRQLRRDRAREVTGREQEPQLECGWYDKQRGERQFHDAEHADVASDSQLRHALEKLGIARQLHYARQPS